MNANPGRIWKTALTAFAVGFALFAAFPGACRTHKKSDSSDRDADSGRKTASKHENAAHDVEPDRAGDSASLMTGDFDPERMNRLVFALTNQVRKTHGLPTLKWSTSLARAATGHSADMARRDYFSHKSGGFFSRTDVRKRIQAAGNTDTRMAENIAMLPVWKSGRLTSGVNRAGYRQEWFQAQGETYQSLARDTMRMWMESPGHRRNLLDPASTELGVGTARGMHGNVPYIYLTQDFGSRSAPGNHP